MGRREGEKGGGSSWRHIAASLRRCVSASSDASLRRCISSSLRRCIAASLRRCVTSLAPVLTLKILLAIFMVSVCHCRCSTTWRGGCCQEFA